MLQLIKNNYRQNRIGYICIWLVLLEKIISVAYWACIAYYHGNTHDSIIAAYGSWYEDYTVKNTNISGFNVSDLLCETFIFWIITIIVIGGAFILSVRNRQNPPKRSVQILYTGLTLFAYSGLLLGLSYWLGQISILLWEGGAVTSNGVSDPLALFWFELIFIVCYIGPILLIYSEWKIISKVFKKSMTAGWILTILAVITIPYIIGWYWLIVILSVVTLF